MAHALGALLAGVLFGLGLAVSQMINPAKVLAFLDIAGRWDPSLALVMAGALAVTALGYRLALRRPAPLLAERFEIADCARDRPPLARGRCRVRDRLGTCRFLPRAGHRLARLWRAGIDHLRRRHAGRYGLVPRQQPQDAAAGGEFAAELKRLLWTKRLHRNCRDCRRLPPPIGERVRVRGSGSIDSSDPPHPDRFAIRPLPTGER